MPATKNKKKNEEVEDDLELDEEEDEEEEEEEEEEESDDDADEEEEEDEDEEEDEEEEKPKKRGRPKGSVSTTKDNPKKHGLGITLLNGVPKKVQILKVMGKNVKICKPGDKSGDTAVRRPITEVYKYDESVFTKMQEIAEKMIGLRDKNYALLKNLTPVVTGKRKLAKGDPLSDW